MASQKPPEPENKFERSIKRKAKRRIRAQQEKSRPVWFGLGMFGLVGWAVTVPTLLGIALGVWIDGRWESSVSWTLNLLIIGLFAGCVNAWYWVKKESNDD